MIKKVKKRNGEIVDFDVSKIKSIIAYATKDLKINPLELESKVQTNLRNNIKTSEIQHSLIQSAVSLITIDNPEWSLVAGRLETYNLQREVYKNHKISYDNFNLKEYINMMIDLGLYDEKILNSYTDEMMDEIQKFLKPEYDLLYNIATTKSLIKKYLIKHKGNTIELPQIANLVIAMYLNKNTNIKYRRLEVKKHYEILSTLKISLATPFKANLRKPNANLSSCFVLEIDDNIDSINHTFSSIAEISKNGGGVGVYLGRLRPSNSMIKGNPSANNIRTWVKILDDMSPAWNQCGIRKGAITASLDVFHKDIESFIELKTESGGDIREKCFNIYPQVILNSQFIKAVRNDLEYPLIDRQEIIKKLRFDVCELDEFNENYDKIIPAIKEGKLQNCNLIKARNLWRRILEVYIETGELYIVNKDNMNKTNPFKDSKRFVNSYNLCCESTSPARPSTEFENLYDYKQDRAFKTFKTGRAHTCNLISINLAEIKNLSELANYTQEAVVMLNNALKLTKVPIIEGELLSEETRIIGIGIMGLADYMAWNKLDYIRDSVEIEKVFETLAFYSLLESYNLAPEFGEFKEFKNSSFSKGIYLGKSGKELAEMSVCGYDWEYLLKRVKERGVVNSQFIAIAPNTSTSLLCGASASYLPVFNKFSYETLDGMNVPVIPKHLKDRFWYYKEVTNIFTKDIIDLTSKISKWIDTGISMELVITEKDNIKDISNSILDGFENDLKAVYYSRSLSKVDSGCSTCAN